MTTAIKNDGIVEVLESDYKRLTQSNADMLEALEAMLQAFVPVTPLQAKATDATRAAIAKAKGGAA